MKGGAIGRRRCAASFPGRAVPPPGTTAVTWWAKPAAALSAPPASSAAMKIFAGSGGVTASFSRGCGAGPGLDPFGPHPHAERGDREGRDDPRRGELRIVAWAERELGVALVADGEAHRRTGSRHGEVPAA